MSIKIVPENENAFVKAQRAYISEKIIEDFTANPLYKRLGTNQQALIIEAIIFHFKNSPFSYSEKVEIEVDDITFVKTVKSEYIFELDVIVPGTNHKIGLKTVINKNVMENRV